MLGKKKMSRLHAVLFFSVLLILAANGKLSAAEWDWTNAKQLTLEGQGWTDTESLFDRRQLVPELRSLEHAPHADERGERRRPLSSRLPRTLAMGRQRSSKQAIGQYHNSDFRTGWERA